MKKATVSPEILVLTYSLHSVKFKIERKEDKIGDNILHYFPSQSVTRKISGIQSYSSPQILVSNFPYPLEFFSSQ